MPSYISWHDEGFDPPSECLFRDSYYGSLPQSSALEEHLDARQTVVLDDIAPWVYRGLEQRISSRYP